VERRRARAARPGRRTGHRPLLDGLAGILRRELGIGYQHAGEVLYLLHAEGIVSSAQDGWMTREVLETARSGLQKLRTRLMEGA
jgi:hypothetical protein